LADRALKIVSLNDPEALGLPAGILAVGDHVLEVAGRRTEDPIDFVFHTSGDRRVSIRVARADGEETDVTLDAQAVADLEIRFEAMDFRRCRCKCPFCFVDQMPAGMRESLYVKDEDFRLSFLYGNFTTMNDVTDAELDKIVEQRNSPQWVSVHVIEEGMRRFIFGRPMTRDIVATLRRLAEGGITVHTQAVIVPGKNDGDLLRETIETLEEIHPNIATLAVVPVGLTRHRGGLPGLRAYRDAEMGEVIDLCEPYRERFLGGPRESHFVFPSDEWYVGAQRDVPVAEAYEGFPQLENGVGSIRHFLAEIADDLDGVGVPRDLGGVRVLTGSLGARVFTHYVLPLLSAHGMDVAPEIVTVENRFFGESVTCSGLLVGADLVSAASRAGAAKPTLIPSNCLNHDGVTIDEMGVDDLSRALGAPVAAPETSFIDALHAFATPGA